MSKLQQWAIDTTLNNGWNYHKFQIFLDRSNQSEFLHSQIPFFYAVQAFPRALANLASKIETNEDRWLIIENLYEEHGQGDVKKFHTSTFKDFLIAIGWDQVHIENPWITEWINNILSKDLNASEYAAYLSGIEYAYAPISKTLADHIDTLELIAPQSHYGVHAELDWIHGDELLGVALKVGDDEEAIKEAFILAQNEFLNLYNHLVLPTVFEMKEINKDPISFYYCREDSTPELLSLTRIFDSGVEEPSILMIGSGGETLIEVLSHKKKINIDVIDMNKHQIDLCKSKILSLLSGEDYSNIDIGFSGKFEKVFSLISEYFNNDYGYELSSYIRNTDEGKAKLKYIVTYLFSNENLSIVFSDKATKYSSDSFSEHFYNVFVQSLNERDNHRVTYKNISNIIEGDDIHPSRYIVDSLKYNYHTHNLNYQVGNFETVNLDKKYDVVSVSNIGDWMSVDEYKQVLLNIKSKLNSGGYIVARKLLGDYKLEDLLKEVGLKTEELNDRTHFYSEVYFGINN